MASRQVVFIGEILSELFLFSPCTGGHVIGEIGRFSLHKSQVGHKAGAYPGFCSMRQLHCRSISTSPWMGR